jgi:hypothetical protein
MYVSITSYFRSKGNASLSYFCVFPSPKNSPNQILLGFPSSVVSIFQDRQKQAKALI